MEFYPTIEQVLEAMAEKSLMDNLQYQNVQAALLRAHNPTAHLYTIERLKDGNFQKIDQVIADSFYDACLIGSYINGLDISDVIAHIGEQYSETLSKPLTNENL